MLDHPLRLAVGSHAAGSGKGCAMNVISWESGDSRITDLPACADPVLAKIVQRVNDAICTHRVGDLLCPDCSVLVLALAHRTVGTGGPVGLDRRRVWVRVAADQARQVLHLAGRARGVALAAIEAAEAWADDPSEENRRAAASAAADAFTAAADAADAYADAYAAGAAAAAAADAAASARLRLAHRAIDTFIELTGHVEQQPDQQATVRAYAAMTRTR